MSDNNWPERMYREGKGSPANEYIDGWNDCLQQCAAAQPPTEPSDEAVKAAAGRMWIEPGKLDLAATAEGLRAAYSVDNVRAAAPPLAGRRYINETAGGKSTPQSGDGIMDADPRAAPELLRVSTDDGKYTIVQHLRGHVSVLRYGEPWLESPFPGVNAMLALAQDLEEARNG